jgi:hypothetical protein
MFGNSNFASKFLGRMFRRINGLSWDLTTGQIGVQDTNGIYSLDVTPAAKEGGEDTYRVSVNPFDQFGTPLPAFAMQVPHEKIAIGDIIVGDKGILGWVIGKKEVALLLLDKNGVTKNYTPPKVAIAGQDGALVVQNLFNLAGGKDGLTGLQGSLLPLLMLGGDDSSLEKVLPLLLFSQTTGTGAGAINPMMLMMLAKGGDIDPMTMMMMSGGMGGGAGGFNPMMMLALQGDKGGKGGLGSLFGGNATPVANVETSNALGAAPALTPLSKAPARRY